MDSQACRPQKRFFSLDVLRGLACFLVLVGHMPLNYEQLNPTVGGVIYSMRRCGWLGVDLFFVLSGLLISGLLFKEIQSSGKIQYWRFLIRRGLKIWPSYFVVFGLLIGARYLDSWALGTEHNLEKLRAGLIPNCLFFQNYVECWRWPHSWSIAVEEHFYILLPLALIGLVVVRRLDLLPSIALSTCIAVLATRIVAVSFGAEWQEIKYRTHYHIDALLFGVLLGYGFAFAPARMETLKRWWSVILTGCAAVLVIVRMVYLKEQLYVYAVGFSVIYVAFGGLVALARLNPDWGTRGPLWLRAPTGALAFIGVYSYTIYLAHGVVFKLPYVVDTLGLVDHPAWAPSLFVIGSIAGGILLSHAVERPFLALRDRFVPSSRKLPAIVSIPLEHAAQANSEAAAYRRAA
jgi:peptidoglycan/LPS O-acetylase OafA/YrhL